MDSILIFRFARLYNIYHHPFLFFLRILILLLILVSLFLSLQQESLERELIGLLLLYFMIGFFFNAKFKTIRPEKKVQEVNESEFYKAFTLPAASVLLKTSDPKIFIKELTVREEIRFVLTRMKAAKDEVAAMSVTKDGLAKEAFMVARQAQKPYVTILDVFAAYLLFTEESTKLLFKKQLKKHDLLTIISWAQNVYPAELTVSLPKIEPWGEGIGEEMISGWTLETQKYTQNFTKKALHESLAATGREKELTLLVESLLKSKEGNVLLIGEPGVGKRHIVASFALRSFLGDVPSALVHLRVLELLSGLLVAGAQTAGELEERLKNILDEVSHAGNVVIYIPQLEAIAGAGVDRLDVTGVLLPHLQGEKIHIIAAITPQNYKAYIEQNTAFADAFDKIIVSEPTKEEAIPMVLDASLLLEERHKVAFSYKAVISSVEVSRKYLPESHLPGKAITLLDEMGAKAKIAGESIVDEVDIVALLESKIPVKVTEASSNEKRLLLHLEEKLHEKIIDQKEAVSTVAQAVRRLRTGLSNEGRPVGVFLFLGPTGVGKTETAKALASVYFGGEADKRAERPFGSEDAMIRVDMSEYQEVGSVNRLIDQLSERVSDAPFSLILLDEFEKAYATLLDVFLAIFEDGRLTNRSGRTVSFENTIIIATSNAGSELIRELLGEGVDIKTIKPEIIDQLQKSGIFKPELLNRFDVVVLFEPLGKEEIAQITELLLKKLTALFSKKDIAFQFDNRAVRAIAVAGFDETMGARPLRRFIQDHVEDLLSKKLLRDEIKRGDTVVLSCDDAGNLTLEVRSD